MIIRKEIRNFSQAMERVMRKHDKIKGDSWKSMSHLELQKLLLKEVNETKDEFAKLQEWIDVANICMMIHNNTINNRIN